MRTLRHDTYLEPYMTIAQLQQLASNFGLKASVPYTSQTQLIRNIQLLRGDEPCFSSQKRYACTEICEWSQDCRKLKAQWMV
jgi:hypothetical protein